jgi:PAS domain S-box-containing protein
MEVNDAYCRMVGYGREELLAMTVDQLEVGESEEEIRARMARIMETGSDLFLAHHRRKDGSVVVLEACMNHDSSVGGLVFGFLRDITERIASEAKVRSSEERYRLLFANNPAPMWVYDLKTLAFIDVNQAAVRHYGYNRDEFLAMKISDIRPPEDVPLLLAEVSGVTEGLDKAGVWHHLKKDGSLISVEIISHTIDFDGHRAELVMSLDVTEREEITRNLRIKSRAIESSLNGVALADLEGRITYVNPSFLRIWGFTREEQVLGRFSTLFWQRPEDAEAVMVSVLKEGTWTGTLNARRQDGSIFNAEVGASLVMDNNGTPLCLMATFIDITERWQAEQENRRLKEELERRVEDRTAQLTASNRELESFCYSVSHDLRTPLRAIAGFSAILRENYAHLLNPEGEDSLLRIERGATTMGALIDDLLTLSRVSRHQMTTEPVDLSALCHEILGQLVSAHPEQQAEAVIEPGITVIADPVLMRQALHNLLENAWKYTSRTPSPRIEFGCRYDEGQQVCFVRDNGAGFDMAFSHKLFGTFERLHSVNEFEGTGIGLATVKRIMERHGGRVWGEGIRGEGATFSFSIPAGP